MFALLTALTLYIVFSPIQPALSIGDYRPGPSRQAYLTPAAAKAPEMPPVKKDQSRLGIETTARAVSVIDWQSGAPLYEKNADQPLPIASLTKLMTALVVLDQDPDWQEMVEIIDADLQIGDIPLLLPGERFTVEDLFNLSLVASSNDATAALARSTGLPPETFTEKMNRLAVEIGMTNAIFADVTGLDPRNAATARDIAVLVRKALGLPVIRETVVRRSYDFVAPSGDKRRVSNTDQLLDSFLNRPPFVFLGGKTGYIDEAGYCFGAAAQDSGGNRVVAVVLGAGSKEDRFREVKRLLYWAFDVFDWPANKQG